MERVHISELRDDHSVMVGKGRRSRVIAREDIRTIPENELAASVVRSHAGSTEKRTNQTSSRMPMEEDNSSSSEEESRGLTIKKKSDNTMESKSTPSQDETPMESKSTPSQDETPMELKPTLQGNEASEEEWHDAGEATAAEGEVNENPEPDDGVPRTRYGRRVVKPVRLTMLTTDYWTRDDAEQKLLREAYDVFHNGQFYRRDAPFVPSWVFVEADKRELEKNWVSSMNIVSLENVPQHANVIGSHFVYKVKSKLDGDCKDGRRMFELKWRLCVHGNHDSEESLRTDAAVVSHLGFRMIYTIAATSGHKLRKADIRGAYTQSGKSKRDVYVRPPMNLDSKQCLWLLKFTVYGIVSAGR